MGIEWLEIATEMYPKEAALYGTLGDFYLKQNRREEAINAYKKALDVDPNFEHAKEMLKKLMIVKDPRILRPVSIADRSWVGCVPWIRR